MQTTPEPVACRSSVHDVSMLASTRATSRAVAALSSDAFPTKRPPCQRLFSHFCSAALLRPAPSGDAGHGRRGAVWEPGHSTSIAMNDVTCARASGHPESILQSIRATRTTRHRSRAGYYESGPPRDAFRCAPPMGRRLSSQSDRFRCSRGRAGHVGPLSGHQPKHHPALVIVFHAADCQDHRAEHRRFL